VIFLFFFFFGGALFGGRGVLFFLFLFFIVFLFPCPRSNHLFLFLSKKKSSFHFFIFTTCISESDWPCGVLASSLNHGGSKRPYNFGELDEASAKRQSVHPADTTGAN